MPPALTARHVMQVKANASALGITNTMQPCYVTAPILRLAENDAPTAQPIGLSNGTLCADPDAHLNWDQCAPHPLLLAFQQALSNTARSHHHDPRPVCACMMCTCSLPRPVAPCHNTAAGPSIPPKCKWLVTIVGDGLQTSTTPCDLATCSLARLDVLLFALIHMLCTVVLPVGMNCI